MHYIEYQNISAILRSDYIAPIETEILFWREALTCLKDYSGKREMAPKISHKSLKETLQMIFRGQ